MITKDYHRTLFLSMILIALGVSISTTMGDSSGTIGTVCCQLSLFWKGPSSFPNELASTA